MDFKEIDKNNTSNDMKRQVQRPLSTNRFFHTRGDPTLIDDIQMGRIASPNLYPVRYRNRCSSAVFSDSVLNSITDNIDGHIVRIRLFFIRIGEIDTLNERYHADVYFEARWIDCIHLNTLDLTAQQRTQLINESATIRLNEFSPIIHWTPKLLIENAVVQTGEPEKWFTIVKIPPNVDEIIPASLIKLEICEHRRVRGAFWEKLELNHFPVDVQDLTISITSDHHLDTVLLVQDEDRFSTINREAFFDQQEWSLYEHVATEIRQTKEEYSFEHETGIEAKKHPVLAFTCRAARQPGYYYWNGFCLIFLITICAFCIFVISPNLPQSRLQITSTLLLTSITFRWVVNRSLPTVSYLTTLDKYAIISIFMLVLLCIWHAIIATVIFLGSSSLVNTLTPNNIYVRIDRYIFFVFISGYVFFHVVLIIWLMCVPYKRRRDMQTLDREYTRNWQQKLDELGQSFQVSPYRNETSNNYRRPSAMSTQSLLNKSPLGRFEKQNDNVFIMPDALTFVPIREEKHGTVISKNFTDLHN
ncbi:unnamed protein product [Rotaria sordida]|uniref:Uncharacterized protein n=2 Tax=Rotaria sordida TaxID=392033 RepID=A0A813SE03_9BILA|nr:unnamed protein product [Rotaria sordida]